MAIYGATVAPAVLRGVAVIRNYHLTWLAAIAIAGERMNAAGYC
jgi:hypothetical protein